jgi:hypothetical protein
MDRGDRLDPQDDIRRREAAARYHARYIHTATHTQPQALNEGLDVAESEFIAVTDDDCWPCRHWLSQLEASLKNGLSKIRR